MHKKRNMHNTRHSLKTYLIPRATQLRIIVRGPSHTRVVPLSQLLVCIFTSGDPVQHALPNRKIFYWLFRVGPWIPGANMLMGNCIKCCFKRLAVTSWVVYGSL